MVAGSPNGRVVFRYRSWKALLKEKRKKDPGAGMDPSGGKEFISRGMVWGKVFPRAGNLIAKKR